MYLGLYSGGHALPGYSRNSAWIYPQVFPYCSRVPWPSFPTENRRVVVHLFPYLKMSGATWLSRYVTTRTGKELVYVCGKLFNDFTGLNQTHRREYQDIETSPQPVYGNTSLNTGHLRLRDG